MSKNSKIVQDRAILTMANQ